jgi:hypothetical protein
MRKIRGLSDRPLNPLRINYWSEQLRKEIRIKVFEDEITK